jgi:hypothetical protein
MVLKIKTVESKHAGCLSITGPTFQGLASGGYGQQKEQKECARRYAPIHFRTSTSMIEFTVTVVREGRLASRCPLAAE